MTNRSPAGRKWTDVHASSLSYYAPAGMLRIAREQQQPHKHVTAALIGWQATSLLATSAEFAIMRGGLQGCWLGQTDRQTPTH